jgi:uroporphyrinogen decarboxylase
MAGMLAAPEAAGRYIHIGIFMLLFERMHALRGFARTLEDLYLEPDLSAELADRLVEFDLRVIRNAASAVGAARIQALTFTDDWGTQTGPFVSPDFWRAFFQPRYRRIFDECHRLGWDVSMHSCGKVNDLVEPLIEAGLNAINLQQPRALGIEEMGRRYRGRICFESCCDIQATLPSGSAAGIRDEARLLLEHWAAPEGGFILYDYGPSETIGSTDEKKKIMLDAFLEFDPWAGRNPVRPLPAVAAPATQATRPGTAR